MHKIRLQNAGGASPAAAQSIAKSNEHERASTPNQELQIPEEDEWAAELQKSSGRAVAASGSGAGKLILGQVSFSPGSMADEHNLNGLRGERSIFDPRRPTQ